MPEGDTVWRAARSLDRALAGHDLVSTDFRVPALATVDLSGYRVLRTVSRGKHLLMHLEGEHSWTLHSHLRMEGAWHVYPPGERWRRPTQQARVVLSATGKVAVGFSLGILELLPRSHEEQAVGHLGPDLLGADWDETTALHRLRSDPSRPIGEALLDQRNLAGIGNLYKSELCFTSGVHPEAPVADVTDLTRMVRRAHGMLDANKERAEQSTTGDLRRGRRTWVYRRDRQPCLRCGTTILVTMSGTAGEERATYWCPSCQPT